MSKQEESKLDKLKHFLGIGAHRGTHGSALAGSILPTTREFIFTDELLKEIGPQSPTQQRLRTVRELGDLVSTKRLEPNAVEAIWQVVRDLLNPQASMEERHTVLKFLQSLIIGQYEQLDVMRAYFFRVISSHKPSADLALRLDLIEALTSDGKDLDHIEDEMGMFLLDWMKDVKSSRSMPDFLRLLINVIKFNAAYMDEAVVSGLIINTCLVVTKAKREEEIEIELSLRFFETVICYSYLPLAALNHLIFCLCQVLNVERFAQDTWQLMRQLLGTHVGHNAVHSMCCILQDSCSMSGNSAMLLRGAVFFISMALWGSKRVPSLKYPPNAVLPAFLQSLIQCGAPLLANEIALSIQRLINKYGNEQPIVTWDLIMDIIEKLLKLIKSNPEINPMVSKNVHDLLTSIETLHENMEFHGSTERFFSIIEMCAHERPESSILMLVSHKVHFIYPSVKDNWILKLNYLMDKYFKQEKRARVRLKALDLVQQIITRNKYLYEEELIDLVVVPHLSDIAETTDLSIKTKAVELILDLVESSQSSSVHALIDVLRKVINKPCRMSQLHSPADLCGPDRPRSMNITEDDIMPVLDGLIKLFKMKLFEASNKVAVSLFDLLVEHLQSHYGHNSHHLLVQPTPGVVRYKLFELFLMLRADTSRRLGLYQKDGTVAYSSFIICTQWKESEFASTPLTEESKATVMSYADVFRCIRLCLEKELDWSVMKLVLDHLPMVLQNKTLLLAADCTDVDRFCARLQAMVSDRSLNLPDKLLNVPPRMTRSDFHGCIFPVLTCLVSYHDMLDKQKQRELVKCLEFGLVSKCARICVRALTVCSLEMVDIMLRLLPSVLLKLSQISATVAMAIPLMEFLSSLIHCPQLYSNFVEDQYMSVFAIALPYTNPFKYSHYTVSLAYNVVGLWFIKCRLPFRKGFVGFILKGLKSNVLRQIEDTISQRNPPIVNQDSSDRNRTQSLNDEALRSEDTTDSRSQAAAASARARTSQPAISLSPLNENLSIFHKELMETCVDMLARYTYSTRSNIPKRSSVAEFLLKGGQSQSWLLGNRIITITTSGGHKVGRAGLCEKCLLAARVASSKFETQKQNVTPDVECSGRRRHKSAAVRTRTEAIPLKLLSQDDILLNNRNLVASSEMRDDRSCSFDLEETDVTSAVSVSREQVPLDTQTEKMQAMDNVLMSLKAKPADKSIFSPHLCNCWCTQWAEIHIRRPTGTFSWIMRIQNEDNLIDSFPDFPLADVSSLFMTDKGQQEFVDLSTKKIDGTTIPEKEYENLWEEHFQGVSGHKFTPMFTIESQPDEGDVFLDETNENKLTKSDDHSLKKQSEVAHESEKKHITEDLTTSLPAVSSKEMPKSMTLEVKVTKEMTSDHAPVSPPVTYDLQKHEARSNRGSSSASFVSIPEDSVTMDTSGDGGQEGRLSTSGSSTHSAKSALYSSVFGKEGPTQGGINPSFLFLQLYHANVFGSVEERPLRLPNDETVQRSLKMLDMIHPFQTHKIGVLYVGLGQVNDEAAILANQYGSERYMQFIQGLGQIIRLRDCSPETTYLGGLDANGSDGQFAYIWQDEILQLVYHVATLMPNKDSDPHCTNKKLHIGNDYISIIYNDSKEDYKIGTIKGQFNYISIVIQPLDHKTSAVTVQTRDDIEELIGHTDTKIISDLYLSSLVRQMALHADVASIILQKQKSDPKDLFASNWLERLRQIKRIRSKVKNDSGNAPSGHYNRDPPQGGVGGLNMVDDFTDFVT